MTKNVERELLNHSMLIHPNVVRFEECFLTDKHLAIVMEYAAGGNLITCLCLAYQHQHSRMLRHGGQESWHANNSKDHVESLVHGMNVCCWIPLMGH